MGERSLILHRPDCETYGATDRQTAAAAAVAEVTKVTKTVPASITHLQVDQLFARARHHQLYVSRLVELVVVVISSRRL